MPSGVPRIFVLSRIALLDLEVLAYESMKWIRKLRGPRETSKGKGKGQPKLLAITAGEGHFAKGPTALRQRAEDLAILDAWTSSSRKKHEGRRRTMRKNDRKGTRRGLRKH